MMWSGVAKSGSPAPNPMTGSPAAHISLARAETARVAEGAMALTVADRRSVTASAAVSAAVSLN